MFIRSSRVIALLLRGDRSSGHAIAAAREDDRRLPRDPTRAIRARTNAAARAHGHRRRREARRRRSRSTRPSRTRPARWSSSATTSTASGPTVLVLAYHSCKTLCNLVQNAVLDGDEGHRWSVGKRVRRHHAEHRPARHASTSRPRRRTRWSPPYGRRRRGEGLALPHRRRAEHRRASRTPSAGSSTATIGRRVRAPRRRHAPQAQRPRRALPLRHRASPRPTAASACSRPPRASRSRPSSAIDPLLLPLRSAGPEILAPRDARHGKSAAASRSLLVAGLIGVLWLSDREARKDSKTSRRTAPRHHGPPDALMTMLLDFLVLRPCRLRPSAARSPPRRRDRLAVQPHLLRQRLLHGGHHRADALLGARSTSGRRATSASTRRTTRGSRSSGRSSRSSSSSSSSTSASRRT